MGLTQGDHNGEVAVKVTIMARWLSSHVPLYLPGKHLAMPKL